MQDNYAMLYKKGLAPPRHNRPTRLSEYSKEFTWKQGMKTSPLLAAEQVFSIYGYSRRTNV